MIFDND